MNVEQRLRELVEIDSVSAKSNAEVISYLRARVEALGFNSRALPYLDELGVEKINMIATFGASPDSKTVELALVGHTDTVPFADDWAEALLLTERDGKLYGRGSCDTKGFIAAAIAAIESLDLRKLRKPLALILTADEEIGCLGAKKLAQANAIQPRYAIVGEPTSLQPMRAGKGYCLAEVILRGREGHSAYPGVGVSAINHAARLIGRIEVIADELKNDQHQAFDPPYTTINIGVIHGGTAKNIIAGECRFTLEWRPIPGQPVGHVLDQVRLGAAELHARDNEFSCEIKPLRRDEAVETPADSALVKMLEEASSRVAGTVAFGTESAQMRSLGADAVVIGPGDIRVAHRTGEFVPIDELNSCVDILAKSIVKFCF
jgi:acetylornithine deacetylase